MLHNYIITSRHLAFFVSKAKMICKDINIVDLGQLYQDAYSNASHKSLSTLLYCEFLSYKNFSWVNRIPTDHTMNIEFHIG